MTKLEEIARDAILLYYPGADLYGIILKALERAQKETFEARAHFDKEAFAEFLKTGPQRKNHEAIDAVYEWLRDNIRLAPVEQVSDKTLRDLAQDFYQWAPGEYLDYREEIKEAFIAGYRKAERKAQGE